MKTVRYIICFVVWYFVMAFTLWKIDWILSVENFVPFERFMMIFSGVFPLLLAMLWNMQVEYDKKYNR